MDVAPQVKPCASVPCVMDQRHPLVREEVVQNAPVEFKAPAEAKGGEKILEFRMKVVNPLGKTQERGLLRRPGDA